MFVEVIVTIILRRKFADLKHVYNIICQSVKKSNVDFRNLCAKLLTTETRVAIFIGLLFNNKNLRYLCLVLFSETH